MNRVANEFDIFCQAVFLPDLLEATADRFEADILCRRSQLT